MIWIWSLVFATIIFRILALYLDFAGAKNIHILNVMSWGFCGNWRFLTGVWHLYLDSDMVTCLCYTYILNLALYLDFEGAKNIHVLNVLICGFGGGWRLLTGVWDHDLDLDMVTGLCHTYFPNFGSLS